MFKVHTLDDDGAIQDAVAEVNHASTARRHALEASELGYRTQVARVVNDKLIVAFVVEPGGKVRPPAGSKPPSEQEVCKVPEPCFCSPCRAARRST